jgi:hypothetical protein
MPTWFSSFLLYAVGVVITLLLLNPLWDFYLKPKYQVFLGKRSEKQNAKNQEHKFRMQTIAKGIANYPDKRQAFYFNFLRVQADVYLRLITLFIALASMWVIAAINTNTPLSSLYKTLTDIQQYPPVAFGLIAYLIVLGFLVLVLLLTKGSMEELMLGYEVFEELRNHYDFEIYPVGDDLAKPKTPKPNKQSS